METIKERIERAKAKVDDEVFQYSMIDLIYIRKIVRKQMKDKSESTLEEILDSIDKRYQDIIFSNSRKRASNRGVETVVEANISDYFLLQTIMYLRSNPGEILDTIDRSDRTALLEPRDYFVYTHNIRENIKQVIQDLCTYFVEGENARQKFINGELGIKERESLKNNILKELVKLQKGLGENRRESYAWKITQMATLLDEIGSFNKGIGIHNRRLRMIGLTDLQILENERGGNKTKIRNVRDWKSMTIVKNLPIEILTAASAFFTNRLSKEYIAYTRIIFALREIGRLDILTARGEAKIDEEEFREALAKYEFLQDEERKGFSMLEEKMENDTRDNSQAVGMVETNIEIEYTCAEQEEYREGFRTLKPSDIVKDRQKIIGQNNTISVMYQRKNYEIDTLVSSLLNKNGKMNWGYVPEIVNGKNSISRGRKKVLLAFDIEGFDTPIRLHYDLERLKRIVKGVTGKNELPVYAGIEDWTIKDQFGQTIIMTTQVLKPTDKKTRKEIKDKAENVKEGDRLYNFLTHLNWIACGIKPDRFKDIEVVSLDTGKTSLKDETSLYK